MDTTAKKKPRRQQILEVFADMLEASPGARITTAALAARVGVSEAALYRHFPSKSKMFEGLIDFIEEAIFARINLIAAEQGTPATEKCERILYLLVLFAERNPGISRILTGAALAGEDLRLHQRVVQFFNRVETHLKQILREAELREPLPLPAAVSAVSGLWLATAEGLIARFVRSEFKELPSREWPAQWAMLVAGLGAAPAAAG